MHHCSIVFIYRSCHGKQKFIVRGYGQSGGRGSQGRGSSGGYGGRNQSGGGYEERDEGRYRGYEQPEREMEYSGQRSRYSAEEGYRRGDYDER
jgi:hypothetical protein